MFMMVERMLANMYRKPSWAVEQTTRETGLIEDLCEHGVGHPNRDFLGQHPEYIGVHGCDGCCFKEE